MVNAGFSKRAYDVGDVVYMVLPFSPTVKKCREYRAGTIYTFKPDNFNQTVFSFLVEVKHAAKTLKKNNV